jgi:hypothetical protein
MQAPASRETPIAALFAIVGGLLTAASFLTWASISAAGQRLSVKGTDGSDGYLTLAAGIILILYGVARLIGNAMGTKKAMAAVAIVAGLVASGVTLYEAVNAKQQLLEEAASQVANKAGVSAPQARALLEEAVDTGWVDISLSFSVFVVIAGGVLGVVGGVVGLRSSSGSTTAMPNMGATGGPSPRPAEIPPPATPEMPGSPGPG